MTTRDPAIKTRRDRRRLEAHAAIKARLAQPEAFAGYVLAVLDKLHDLEHQAQVLSARIDKLQSRQRRMTEDGELVAVVRSAP